MFWNTNNTDNNKFLLLNKIKCILFSLAKDITKITSIPLHTTLYNKTYNPYYAQCHLRSITAIVFLAYSNPVTVQE